MVRDFNNNFKEYLGSLMNEAMNELRSDNYSFMELEEHERKLYEATEKMIKQLPETDRNVIEDFLETSGQVILISHRNMENKVREDFFVKQGGRTKAGFRPLRTTTKFGGKSAGVCPSFYGILV